VGHWGNIDLLLNTKGKALKENSMFMSADMAQKSSVGKTKA
jgi:hypothetical protein